MLTSGSVSVSYIHLDVYKRQEVNCTILLRSEPKLIKNKKPLIRPLHYTAVVNNIEMYGFSLFNRITILRSPEF